MALDRRAIFAAASGALVALGAYALTHRPSPGRDVAQVIERQMTPSPDPEAVEDQRLTGDANEAGYRWAERRDLIDVAHCPNYSSAFHDGCAAYVSDQKP